MVGGDYLNALPEFKKSWELLGEDYAGVIHSIGDCLWRLNQNDSALVYFNHAIELDSNCWESRMRLMALAHQSADTAAYLVQYDYLMRNSPWVFENSQSQ